MRIVVVGKTRILWRCLLLNTVTLGVYRRVWLVRVRRELNGHEGQRFPLGWAALMAAIPFVSFFLADNVTRANATMLRRSPSPLKAALFWRILNAIPVLGTTSSMLWQQSRLNRFWSHERTNPEAGLEIDLDLESNPRFLVEMGEALKASYQAGGAVEGQWRKKQKATWAARNARYHETRRIRAQVRALGGSTPVLFWRRPPELEPRLLHITCGRCQTRFDVTSDGLSETVILCPTCALVEVLPGAVGNLRGKPEAAAVASLKVRCKQCRTQFHALRRLGQPTPLSCPSCGRKDTLPAKGAAA